LPDVLLLWLNIWKLEKLVKLVTSSLKCIVNINYISGESELDMYFHNYFNFTRLLTMGKRFTHVSNSDSPYITIRISSQKWIVEVSFGFLKGFNNNKYIRVILVLTAHCDFITCFSPHYFNEYIGYVPFIQIASFAMPRVNFALFKPAAAIITMPTLQNCKQMKY